MSCFTLDYQTFIDAINTLFTKFPFSLLQWIYDLLTSLAGIVPAMPNVSLDVFFLHINPLAFLLDYSSIFNPLMFVFRWFILIVLVSTAVVSYTKRLL